MEKWWAALNKLNIVLKYVWQIATDILTNAVSHCTVSKKRERGEGIKRTHSKTKYCTYLFGVRSKTRREDVSVDKYRIIDVRLALIQTQTKSES